MPVFSFWFAYWFYVCISVFFTSITSLQLQDNFGKKLPAAFFTSFFFFASLSFCRKKVMQAADSVTVKCVISNSLSGCRCLKDFFDIFELSHIRICWWQISDGTTDIPAEIKLMQRKKKHWGKELGSDCRDRWGRYKMNLPSVAVHVLTSWTIWGDLCESSVSIFRGIFLLLLNSYYSWLCSLVGLCIYVGNELLVNEQRSQTTAGPPSEQTSKDMPDNKEQVQRNEVRFC